MRFLSELYASFYGTSKFHEIRSRLDDGYTEDSPRLQQLKTAVTDSKFCPLAESFVDYLNFFEWIAVLWKTESLLLTEVEQMFKYYLTALARHGFVVDYISRQDFENLSVLLVCRSPHLFVYGTLRSDIKAPRGAPSLANHGRLLGLGHTQGRLYQVTDEYPGMVLEAGVEERVAGEVWLLKDPEAAFKELDKYEEPAPHMPREYERALRRVEINGGKCDAWVYCWIQSTEGRRLIRSGDIMDSTVE